MGNQLVIIDGLHQEGSIKKWTTSIVNPNGTLRPDHLTFPDNETLYQELPKYKIMICFPQCDTNPARGGNVEALTQRYWEAMLSGCLMIGRALQELIDLLGYNPVVNVDWNKPKQQLREILNNIANHQTLIDKNYETAQRHASWDKRIPAIKEFLKQNGYEL